MGWVACPIRLSVPTCGAAVIRRRRSDGAYRFARHAAPCPLVPLTVATGGVASADHRFRPFRVEDDLIRK